MKWQKLKIAVAYNCSNTVHEINALHCLPEGQIIVQLKKLIQK